MKKIILSAILIVFFFPSFSFSESSKLNLSGSMVMSGIYKENEYLGAKEFNNSSQRAYLAETVSFKANFNVNDTSSFTTKIILIDRDLGYDPDMLSSKEVSASQDSDDISLDRCFMSNRFESGTGLYLGLMDGGAWATRFGDTVDGAYRIRVTQETEAGTLIAVYQKDVERGEAKVKGSDNDDKNTYYLGLYSNVQPFEVYPMFKFVDNGALSSSTEDLRNTGDERIFAFDFGVKSNLSPFFMEAEFVIESYKYSSAMKLNNNKKDYSVWGGYIDLWRTFNSKKIGCWFAYGQYDSDSNESFSFGESFDQMVLLEDLGFGNPISSTDDSNSFTTGKEYLSGVFGFQVYANIPINQKNIISTSFTYLSSNVNTDIYTNTKIYKDTAAYEFDLSYEYKISANVSYTCIFAAAGVDRGVGDKLDPAFLAKHSFALNF